MCYTSAKLRASDYSQWILQEHIQERIYRI